MDRGEMSVFPETDTDIVEIEVILCWKGVLLGSDR